MDSSEYTNLFIDISRNLGEINSKLGFLCESIAKHEVRLTELEKDKGGGHSDWKSEIIRLLVRAIVISAVGITTLAGGGGIIMKMFGG